MWKARQIGPLSPTVECTRRGGWEVAIGEPVRRWRRRVVSSAVSGGAVRRDAGGGGGAAEEHWMG